MKEAIGTKVPKASKSGADSFATDMTGARHADAAGDRRVASPGGHSVHIADQPPLANLITLGARDFPGLRDFYRRLGWPQIMDDGEFAVFELRGILLALFPIAQLARDGNTEPEPGTGGIASPSASWPTQPRRSTG